MRLTESIMSAFASVLSNKMRTFLTMLGIIIGISSVIMINSVGNGIKTAFNKEFNKLGSNLISIYLKSWNDGVEQKDFLTSDDIELIKQHKNIDYVAPRCSGSATVTMRNKTETYCYITGTTADYVKSGKTELTKGRFINDFDNKNQSNSAVITEWLAKSIFGYTNVIGKSFTADFDGIERELVVVGLLKSEEQEELVTIYGKSEIIMPFDTVNSYYGNNDYVDQINAGVKDMTKLNETTKEIDKLLSLTHQNSDMYGIESLMSEMSVINNVLTGVTLFIAFVAAISLVVGGIGVMNIMLVTVTERTREIGIRKSLGATDGDIRVQFLIEAVILSVIGGTLGVLLGYLEGIGAGVVISSLAKMDLSAKLSGPTVILAFFITVVIGIIFGVYPAGKAAKLDPIEALRYE